MAGVASKGLVGEVMSDLVQGLASAFCNQRNLLALPVSRWTGALGFQIHTSKIVWELQRELVCDMAFSCMQKFYDKAEAIRYARLSKLEQREYAVQRLTIMGDPDASYASIDLAHAVILPPLLIEVMSCIVACLFAAIEVRPGPGPAVCSQSLRSRGCQVPVFSSVAGQWGQHRYTMQNLFGPLPMEQKEFRMMTELTDYFPDRKHIKSSHDVLAAQLLPQLQRVKLGGPATEQNTMAAEEEVALRFIAEMNASRVDIDMVACLARYGLPELSCVWNLEESRADVHRMRSHLWKLLLGLLPADTSRWQSRMEEWKLVHERAVLLLCKEAEHDPWELMEDYDGEGQHGVIANWSELDAGGVGGFASMDWVVEDIAREEGLRKGAKPAIEERWHRMWGNPCAVVGPDGSAAVRRAAEAVQTSAERWRELFAAKALWDDIAYDTYNGTYPHLYSLIPEDRPIEKERLEELRWKEDDGVLTAKVMSYHLESTICFVLTCIARAANQTH